MSERFDPRSLSMNLWHALIGRGVDADEATTLMNGYAHELAERQRASGRDDYCAGTDCCGEHGGVADLIDPHVSAGPARPDEEPT